MKDLDFDELDRAVNSLMSNVPKSAPQITGTNEKTLDLGSLGGDSQGIPAKLEDMAKKAAEQEAPTAMPVPSAPPVSSPSVTATPRPAAPAVKAPDRPQSSAPAVRRGGRFMDVVHPSSDMKKPETPRPVSRQGVTIEPVGKAAPGEPVVQPKTFAPAPVMTETEKEPADEPKPVADDTLKPLEPPKIDTSVKNNATTEPAPSSSDWPDPLDMVAKNDTAAPLTSPFLADAKVEKRPLGGLSAPETDDKKPEQQEALTPELDLGAGASELQAALEEMKPQEKEPTASKPETSPMPTPKLPGDEDLTAPLPEELQGDLMAVEADTTHDEMKQKHDTELKKEQPADSEEEKPVSKETLKVEPKSDSSAPSGPTSIPQQYHEEPSTGDQENGAIYDTSAYHQPLAHPAKKKSGWLWIVWIVAILLLGAAGGAAIYFFKLV
jgi:hypothetical protein